jgi:hypothetical protein
MALRVVVSTKQGWQKFRNKKASASEVRLAALVELVVSSGLIRGVRGEQGGRRRACRFSRAVLARVESEGLPGGGVI